MIVIAGIIATAIKATGNERMIEAGGYDKLSLAAGWSAIYRAHYTEHGAFPMVNLLDCYVDLDDSAIYQLMMSRLAQKGMFTFTLRGLNARQELLDLAEMLGSVHRHAHADEYGVTVLLPKEETADLPGLLGFSRKTLDLHTDCSAVSAPPDLIVNYCSQAASSGGETLLVDMKEVYEELLQGWPGWPKT